MQAENEMSDSSSDEETSYILSQINIKELLNTSQVFDEESNITVVLSRYNINSLLEEDEKLKLEALHSSRRFPSKW